MPNIKFPAIPTKFRHAYVHVYTCASHKTFRANIIAPSDHCFENGMVFDCLFSPKFRTNNSIIIHASGGLSSVND